MNLKKLWFFLTLGVVLTLLGCAHFHKKKFSYSREQYPHWLDEDQDCQNTRQEILITRSLIPVRLDRKGCKVTEGLWRDYYIDEELRKVKDIDVDHLIPLKNAHLHGAADWTDEKKRLFANDEQNLVITHKRYNRSKGSKDIGRWLPKDSSYACRYIQDWIKVKKKYGLQLSQDEVHTVSSIQKKCQIRF